MEMLLPVLSTSTSVLNTMNCDCQLSKSMLFDPASYSVLIKIFMAESQLSRNHSEG